MIYPDDVDDWCSYCEGRANFEEGHFSTLLMELFSGTISLEDTASLKKIFQYFPTADAMVELLIQMDAVLEDKTDDDILSIVNKDLHAKRPIIAADSNCTDVVRVIDGGARRIIVNENEFDRAMESSIGGQFHHCIASYLMQLELMVDMKYRLMSEAFHKIANLPPLEWALSSKLMDLEIRFDHYIGLYMIGVDYALTTDGITIMNYRAAYSA